MKLNPRFIALCLMPTLIALLVLPAWSGASPAFAGAKPYHIAGAARDDAGKWKPTDVLEENRLGVNFQMQFLPPDMVRQALKSAIGREVDLLPGRRSEHRRGYLVFVLQITNNSREDVTFNPTQVRLANERGDMEFAMDYSALYEISRPLGPDAPELDELGAAIFDRTVTIRVGGSVRKLLAFPGPREDKYKTMSVLLAEVNVGTTAVDIAFPFRKFFDK